MKFSREHTSVLIELTFSEADELLKALNKIPIIYSSLLLEEIAHELDAFKGEPNE